MYFVMCTHFAITLMCFLMYLEFRIIGYKHPETGESVMRAYTPMGCGLGYVDFVIKVYFANVHPKFPDGGKLTQILDRLNVGDTIDVKGSKIIHKPSGMQVDRTDALVQAGDA